MFSPEPCPGLAAEEDTSTGTATANADSVSICTETSAILNSSTHTDFSDLLTLPRAPSVQSLRTSHNSSVQRITNESFVNAMEEEAIHKKRKLGKRKRRNEKRK